MRTRQQIETEIRRIRRRLRDLVEDSDVPRWQVDEELGRSKGYLSQLLAGTIDLKYRHLVSVLDAIGCSPHRFFQEVFPRLPPRGRRPRRNPRLEAMLTTDPDTVGVYTVGIEAVQELRRRLERCERKLDAALASRAPGGWR